jgi:hypothetical protein
MMLSIMAYSLSASPAKCSNTLCQMPFLAQRLNRRWLFFPVAEALRQVAPRNSGAVSVEHSRSAYRFMGQPSPKPTHHESNNLLLR